MGNLNDPENELIEKWKTASLRDQSFLIANDNIEKWQLIDLMDISKELKERHLNYSGPRDILNWIGQRHRVEWKLPLLYPKSLTWSYPRIPGWIESLMKASKDVHRSIFSNIQEWDGKYRGEYEIFDLVNAIDYHYFSTLLPECKKFLDYGGGYGRQAFLTMNMMPEVKFFVTDAIERCYLMQTWTFSHLKHHFFDYLMNPEVNKEDILKFTEQNQKCILHIPSWRNDLLPKAWFDCVVFVWSIGEMSESAALHALETTVRVLMPGGYVYIRDDCYRDFNKVDDEKFLLDNNFEIVYNSRAKHISEAVGVLRLFRKKW